MWIQWATLSAGENRKAKQKSKGFNAEGFWTDSLRETGFERIVVPDVPPKVVMYNNCGGERMALDVDNIGTNMYGDLAKQGLLDFSYRVMNLKEGSYEQIPHTGLSPHYVCRETKCTPQSVKTAVTAAFQAERSGPVAFS